MDEAAIIEEFNRPAPWNVCFKQASTDAGVGFNPWHFFSELSGCGSIILGVLLVLALIPAFRQEALIAAALFTGAVGILALLQSIGSSGDVRHHRRLARCGEAVIGQVTSRTSLNLNDGTPAPGTEVSIEYEFRIRSGQELKPEARKCPASRGRTDKAGEEGRVRQRKGGDKPRPYTEGSRRGRACPYPLPGALFSSRPLDGGILGASGFNPWQGQQYRGRNTRSYDHDHQRN